MDSRFKNLDNELNFRLNQEQMDSFFETFDDLVMDEAFREAATASKYAYSPNLWDDFVQKEPELIQDDSFVSAAKDYNTTYNSAYWDQAHQALINEGLHYQYKSAYWSEAEKLLVQADKRAFFMKWIGIASAFLIIGLVGINMTKTSVNNNKPLSSTHIFETTKKIEYTQKRRFTFSDKAAVEIKDQTTANTPSITISNQKNELLAEAVPQTVTPQSTLKTVPEGVSKTQTVALPEPELKSNTITEATPAPETLPNIVNNDQSNTQALEHDANLNATSYIKPQKAMAYIEPENEAISPEKTQQRQKTFIPKISLLSSLPTALTQDHSISAPQKMDDIRFYQTPPSSLFSFYVIPKVGIGNSFFNAKNYSYRFGLDMELEYHRKRLIFGLTGGLTYENIDNYVYKSYENIYHRSGEISRVGTDFFISNTINWQSTFLVGYELNRLLTIKGGLGHDIYIGSIARMQNVRNQELITTTNQYTIGRNDEFTNHNFNLIGRIEFKVNKRTEIMASGEFGLLNKMNSENYPLLLPNKNIGLLLGLKYKIFK